MDTKKKTKEKTETHNKWKKETLYVDDLDGMGSLKCLEIIRRKCTIVLFYILFAIAVAKTI